MVSRDGGSSRWRSRRSAADADPPRPCIRRQSLAHTLTSDVLALSLSPFTTNNIIYTTICTSITLVARLACIASENQK